MVLYPFSKKDYIIKKHSISLIYILIVRIKYNFLYAIWPLKGTDIYG